MDELSVYIGHRIKNLRKQQGITSQHLGNIIGKSHSVISKYESGSIAPDINTLGKIADALRVPLAHLVDYPSSFAAPVVNASDFFGNHELFAYYYDGRRQELMKSYLVIQPGNEKSNDEKNDMDADIERDIYFYLGVSDFTRYEDSDFIYKGTMSRFDFVTYFIVENQVNPVDQLSICVFNPLYRSYYTWGMIFALLSKPIAPYCTKLLLSSQMLSDTEITEEKLSFTREELSRIRRDNMLYVDRE